MCISSILYTVYLYLYSKKGDLLLEFDIDAIKKAGCEIQTPVIVTNADAYEHLIVENDRIVIGG